MAAESSVRIIFMGDSTQAVRSVSRLESSFGTLGRTAKLAAGILGVAVVGGLVEATKAAVEFQSQMELVHTQAGASTKEVQRMSKALLGLASTVGTGPEDLAKSLYHVESAGIRGAKALGVVKAAAEGAKIGQADLETTTNALIGAFKSGVKGAGSMQHAMAVMIATVGAGNMRMNDLTSAMGTGLLSAAKGVGLSIQDVGAALAELTIQGQGATEASTRLQMAFLTMAAGTTKGDAALKSIGITQDKLAVDMRQHGLTFALQDLQQHLQESGKTAVEQTAIIADVFGRRSLKAILPLIQHMDDLRKRQEQINKTTSQYGADWHATQQTAAFALEKAKASIQAAAIPIGTLLLPLVGKVAGAIGEAANKFGEFGKKLQNAPSFAAKFKVIAAGAVGMGKAIVKALQDALLGFSTPVDPATLHHHAELAATTFHDGLVQKLQGLDWSVIGQKIGEGITSGIKVAGSVGKSIVSAITDAMAKADWSQIATKAGPFIALAVATAISTALDPTFWLHNWQLALSIALVAFGGTVLRMAGEFATPIVRMFADMAPELGAAIGRLVGAVAEKLPGPLENVFRSVAEDSLKALQALARGAADIGGKIVSAIAGRVAKLPGLLRFTLKVLGVDAAISAISRFGQFLINEIGKAGKFVLNLLGKIPGAIKSAFDTGPLGGMVSAIETVINAVRSLIHWIAKIPSSIHLPHIPGTGGGGGIPFIPPILAEGGVVPGSAGAAVPIIAHAGEVVLNRAQQQVLGGAAFFKRTFGFTGQEGPGFATGGIVNKRPKKSPHRPRAPRYIVKNKLAKRMLGAIDRTNQDEDDADRAYGQLSRQYQIADTDLQFIRTDANGNSYVSQPDISQRLGEIDSLIAARNHMLALLATEKKELESAIKELQAAIAAMLAQIRRERAAIKSLAAKMSAERKKKKPNQNLLNSWQKQVSAHGTKIGNLTSTISGFRQAIGSEQLNLKHQLPFDVRDVQLDIMELKQERKDDAGTSVDNSGGGGGSAGGGAGGAGGTTDDSAEIASLLAQIAQLKFALGIQVAQQKVIGSFAKGTLSVPETGLALVHAGEQIVPAGQVKGGDGGTYGPIQVNLSLSGPLEPLAQFITATVDSPQVADKISVRIGQRASARARSGRY